MRRIAKAIGVSVGMVHRYIEQGLQETIEEPAERLRTLELMKAARSERNCAKVIQEAWKAWNPRETVELPGDDGDGGERAANGILKALGRSSETLRVILDAERTVLKVRERRAKLLGLDAPAKSEVSASVGGGPATPAEAARLVQEAFGSHAVSHEDRDPGPAGPDQVPERPSSS